ncbi:MAG TPA: hypothetical protein VKV15_09140 [Bryobacteraceae bacterium]|nr:hypothetical protein [Bryobacteraceae bacterium]
MKPKLAKVNGTIERAGDLGHGRLTAAVAGGLSGAGHSDSFRRNSVILRNETNL